MIIKVLKTPEITGEQWSEIVSGFIVSFNRNTSIETLKRYYLSTIKGFSYHAIAVHENGKIIGFNTITPMQYKELIFGYSGGTYVREEYRKDITILKRMLSALEDYCSKEDIVAFLAVPNKNSFTYFTRMAGFKKIDSLNYFILIQNISNSFKKGGLKVFNALVYPANWIILSINYLISLAFNFKEKEVEFEISPDNDFFSKRFFQKHYHQIKRDDFYCIYRIVNEDKVRTAYLFDFRLNGKRNYRALVKSVYHILKSNSSDMIVFIGHLRLFQLLLVKVPRRYEPLHLPLVFKIINNKYKDEAANMANPKYWNFGLLNFDVR